MIELSVLWGVWAMCVGAIVGSFLNALSFRWGTGRGMVFSRSACMRCGHTLGALELVPVLSYLVLRGRCRWCRTKISPQYPLVEISAALLALGVYITEGLTLMAVFWFCVWMLLLFVAIYDLRHTIVPWSCSLLLGVLGFGYAFYTGGLDALWAGPVLALPLVAVYAVSRGRWMGLGDGLLEFGLGWLLGLAAGFTALLIAFWSGAIVGLFMLYAPRLWRAKGSGYTIKSEIPFTPFLLWGALVVYFWHVDLFSITSLWY